MVRERGGELAEREDFAEGRESTDTMANTMAGPQSLKRKLDSAGIDVKDDDRRDRCYK